MSEWINVKDEYPPLNESVLVYYNRIVAVAVRFDDVSMRTSTGLFDHWIKIDDNIMWMPLPEPPK